MTTPNKQFTVGEIVSRRSRTAKHYYNPDGKFAAQISSGPVHYKNDQGQWLDIDNNLVASDIAGFQFRNAANEFRTYFAASASASPLVKAQSKQLSLTLTPLEALSVPATSTGSSVTYPGAMAQGTADLRYTVKS